jgi:uncharacterized coiled-coil protein SlyX
MSQIDEEVLSGAEEEQEGIGNAKLVPVAESIRYRRRAQGAEKKVEELSEQLAAAQTEAARMSEQLSALQKEQELMRRLAVAGTKDLETAVLIAKARMEGSEKADLDGVIEGLKREKQYLFVENSGGVATSAKTAGAKERVRSGRVVLETAAKKAATTGNRADMLEYLKRRRSVI